MAVKSHLKYFASSWLFTAVGLAVGFAVGYRGSGTWSGGLAGLFLTLVLGILEISLSVDNAVVNASILRQMSVLWRERFITWGMLIAVFGMRIVFPLLVVSGVGHVGPWQALQMALYHPREYAEVMLSAHDRLVGFGASFLLMVCLRYFFDEKKDVHWLPWIERSFVSLGRIRAIELSLCALLLALLGFLIRDENARPSFLIAGASGLLAFSILDLGIRWFQLSPKAQGGLERASAALFVYLEILDASFSFDGVIGAFALTQNIFIIAAGLGIGAMFVRSFTILLVEKDTFRELKFLEHGAFYAIGALALVMLLSVFVHVPEVVTGLVGASIIALSIFSSLRQRKKSDLYPPGALP